MSLIKGLNDVSKMMDVRDLSIKMIMDNCTQVSSIFRGMMERDLGEGYDDLIRWFDVLNREHFIDRDTNSILFDLMGYYECKVKGDDGRIYFCKVSSDDSLMSMLGRKGSYESLECEGEFTEGILKSIKISGLYFDRYGLMRCLKAGNLIRVERHGMFLSLLMAWVKAYYESTRSWVNKAEYVDENLEGMIIREFMDYFKTFKYLSESDIKMVYRLVDVFTMFLEDFIEDDSFCFNRVFPLKKLTDLMDEHPWSVFDIGFLKGMGNVPEITYLGDYRLLNFENLQSEIKELKDEIALLKGYKHGAEDA